MSSRGHSTSRPAPPMIYLYDIKGHADQPWAPNIWRIRFILNYKRLPYQTIWLEFQDVEREMRRISAPPSSTRSDGRPVYTLPVIVDQSRSHPKILSNANTIAEYLESTYQARPVFPEGSRAMQTLFVHFIQDVFSKPLLPIMAPMSYSALPERTQAHFGARQPSLAGAQREQQWAVVKEQFDFLSVVMDKNTGDSGDGIVAMGNEVSYADFAICAVLIWIERMAPHDGWARVRAWNNGRWHRLWERCREFMDEM